MNKYYTNNLKDEKIQELKDLRGAHNLWYIYCKPELKKKALNALRGCLAGELKKGHSPYGFESVLDSAGYRYFQVLKNPYTKHKLWEPIF
jgi:hypothetical protein